MMAPAILDRAILKVSFERVKTEQRLELNKRMSHIPSRKSELSAERTEGKRS